MSHFSYEPSWSKFCRESLIHDKENPEMPSVAREEYKEFWHTVWKLQEKGQKCECSSNEQTQADYCTKCFLPCEKKEWTWYPPTFGNSGGRWMCVHKELEKELKDFGYEEGPWGFLVGVRREKLWKIMRRFFWQTQAKKCIMCSKSITLEEGDLDHIIEKINGGRESLDNLQFLCRACHKMKNLSIHKK